MVSQVGVCFGHTPKLQPTSSNIKAKSCNTKLRSVSTWTKSSMKILCLKRRPSLGVKEDSMFLTKN